MLIYRGFQFKLKKSTNTLVMILFFLNVSMLNIYVLLLKGDLYKLTYVYVTSMKFKYTDNMKRMALCIDMNIDVVYLMTYEYLKYICIWDIV